jgi:hypothetical protein
MNLKSMSVDRLMDLRNRVAAALSAKVVEQRRTLESGLAKLTRFQGGARSKAGFGWGARAKLLRNTAIPIIQPKPGQGAA